MKILTRLAAVVLFQVGVVVAVILAFSGSPMGAEESQITPNAQPLAAIVTEVPEAPVAPAVIEAPPEVDGAAFAGTFTGSGPFNVVGDAVVFEDDLGQRTLRLTDDFRTNRGQQLAVVLRSPSGEFVSLGDLQAPSGGQEFQIPELTNLTRFNEVQIWDVQANIDFGRAFLAAVSS